MGKVMIGKGRIGPKKHLMDRIFEFPFRLGEQTLFLHSVRTFQTDVPDLLSMRGHEGPYFSRGPLELCGVYSLTRCR